MKRTFHKRPKNYSLSGGQTNREVMKMSKQGMKRPDQHEHHDNSMAVPEISGKAKHGHNRANPIIAGTRGADMKVWHTKPYSADIDKPISDVYPEIDTDLARDNIENDMTSADLQDL